MSMSAAASRRIGAGGGGGGARRATNPPVLPPQTAGAEAAHTVTAVAEEHRRQQAAPGAGPSIASSANALLASSFLQQLLPTATSAFTLSFSGAAGTTSLSPQRLHTATATATTPAPQVSSTVFIDVDGPVDPEETLIRYEVPFAPTDPRRSLQLRHSLGLAVEERVVDPNVRVIVDRVIPPRRWRDAATGLVWVQHASPFPTSRTETQRTHDRLREKLQRYHAKRTGTCPIRTMLLAECFLEVIRQVVTECWERGLLLLHVHAERVASQAAHRALFESRVGHAFRLALKGEKDTAQVEEEIGQLQQKIAALEEEEKDLRQRCNDFEAYAEEQMLIDEKQHSDAITALRKEGMVKRNQLEAMIALPPPQP